MAVVNHSVLSAHNSIFLSGQDWPLYVSVSFVHFDMYIYVFLNHSLPYFLR